MSSVSVRYSLQLRAADGSIRDTREGHNLIMRGAISRFFDPGAPIAKFSAGTGTYANRTDSGAVTFSNNWANSSSQFTLTASAGFFTSGIVGCTVRLADLSELVVIAYTNATTITVDAVASAPAQNQTGTVFWDNQTGLQASISQWNLLAFNSPTLAVSQTATSATITATYVCQTAVATGPYTVRELGWFNSSNSLTGRADISGSPLNALQGDYITCSVVVTWSIDCAAKTVSAGAFSGTSRFYGCSSSLYLSGYGYVYSVWPSSSNAGIALFSTAPDLTTIHNNYWNGSIITTASATATDTTPTASTVKRTLSATISSGSGNIAAIGFIRPTNHNDPAWVHKLDTPVSKSTLQTVTVGWAHTVTRTLPA